MGFKATCPGQGLQDGIDELQLLTALTENLPCHEQRELNHIRSPIPMCFDGEMIWHGPADLDGGVVPFDKDGILVVGIRRYCDGAGLDKETAVDSIVAGIGGERRGLVVDFVRPTEETDENGMVECISVCLAALAEG